jgi:hypothetical protein
VAASIGQTPHGCKREDFILPFFFGESQAQRNLYCFVGLVKMMFQKTSGKFDFDRWIDKSHLGSCS